VKKRPFLGKRQSSRGTSKEEFESDWLGKKVVKKGAMEGKMGGHPAGFKGVKKKRNRKRK